MDRVGNDHRPERVTNPHERPRRRRILTGLALIYGPEDDQPAIDGLVISLFQSEDQPAKEMYIAQPVASDGYLDVALLQIEETIDGDAVDRDSLNLPAVEIGDSDALDNGESVTVIGYPGVGGGHERAINFSRGVVSGFEKDGESIPTRAAG